MPDWRTAKPMSPYHKGEGNVTDDTLMTNLLVAVYAKNRRHLDGVRHGRRPRPADDERASRGSPSWSARPSRCCGCSSPRSGWSRGSTTATSTPARPASATSSTAAPRCTWHRWASPTPVTRPAPTPRRSRSPGPTSPATAARRQRSSPPPWPPRWLRTPTVDGVLATAAGIARDGTRTAIEACVGAVEAGTDWREAIPLLRAAVTPYDSVGEIYREPAQDSRRPSRLRSIEELPVALGLLKATGGDARGTDPGRRRTTAATPTRSRRWVAPWPAPWAARRRSPPTGPRPSAPRRGSTCAPGDGPWPRSPPRSSPPTRPPGTSAARRSAACLEDRSGA